MPAQRTGAGESLAADAGGAASLCAKPSLRCLRRPWLYGRLHELRRFRIRFRQAMPGLRRQRTLSLQDLQGLRRDDEQLHPRLPLLRRHGGKAAPAPHAAAVCTSFSPACCCCARIARAAAWPPVRYAAPAASPWDTSRTAEKQDNSGKAACRSCLYVSIASAGALKSTCGSSSNVEMPKCRKKASVVR